MDKYESFYEQVRKAAQKFSNTDKKETIRLISHLDADGISACSIFVKLLNNENRRYVVSIVSQLNKEVLIIQLGNKSYKSVFDQILSTFKFTK